MTESSKAEASGENQEGSTASSRADYFPPDPLPKCAICGLIPEPATYYCGRCWYWVTKYGAHDARVILGFEGRS